MNAAALNVYQHIRTDGTQQHVLNTMQTRADLYDYLGYHAYEQKLDQLFAKEKDPEKRHRGDTSVLEGARLQPCHEQPPLNQPSFSR